MTVKIIHGDCRDILPTLPSDSFDCIVTSPPYWGLRDYGVDGQIGLERTPEEFVSELVAIFMECRRVLKETGTVWLNMGDTMNNRRRIRSTSHQPSLNGFQECSWAEAARRGLTRSSINDGDLKEKDAVGVPWMLAFALRKDGWFLRQEIIWAKDFGKPEPSVDRLPTRHEQIFLLSKSKRYFFDRDSAPIFANGTVWRIPPVGYEKHGATFPTALVDSCIKIGCPQGGTILDPFGGAGTTGLVADRIGRNATLIELNPLYRDLAMSRITGDAPLFAEVAQ